MKNKRWSYFLQGKLYQGLEIYQDNNQEYFSLIRVQQKAGELEIIDSIVSQNFNDILNQLEKKQPLFLTFNSLKVLKKLVPVQAKDKPEILLRTAFPNIDLGNFYYQALQSSTNAVVCICKREYVQQYLDQLQRKKFTPFEIAIGVCELSSISRYINAPLHGVNFNIAFNDGELIAFNTTTEIKEGNLDTEGLTLKQNEFLSFSQILGYLGELPKISNLKELNSQLAKAFENSRLFYFGLRFSLIFFLILLLGNFMIFNHYHTENQHLETLLSTNQSQNNSLKAIKQRVALKEERLKMLSNSKNSKVSFFLDELGKRIPHSIYLSDIEFQPLLSPIRKDKSIELSKNSLQISGVTNDKVAFTIWSDNLEMQKWVNRVEIMDYEYISNSSANFTLNLVLNETK